MYKSKSLSELRTNADLHPANLRVGMWAFILHRITGLALVFYIILHIFVIATVNWGAGAFDQIMRRLTSPTFVVLDIGLVAAVLFHGLNGIRILLFDLGYGIKRQQAIFWGVMAVATIVFAFAAYASLSFLLARV